MAAEYGRLLQVAQALVEDPRWSPWPAPHVLEQVDSTMAWLRERADAPDGTAVIADEQTAGRGRLGRAWASPPGVGVWTSVLIRADGVDTGSLGVLPLQVGNAIAEHLSTLSGVSVAVKWPNDIVVEIDDRVRKIAGVLTERLSDGALIIGVGANAIRPDNLPPDLLPDHAIAVDQIGDSGVVTREQVANAVLIGIAEAARSWASGDRGLETFRRRCITLGREVRVGGAPGSADWIGFAQDVDEDGGLLVRRPDGQVVRVTAGDVTLGSGPV